MTSNHRLPRKTAEELKSIADLEACTYKEILNDFIKESKRLPHLPEPLVQRDPRTNIPICYSPGREKRPVVTHEDRCPICRGNLTGLIDVFTLQKEEFGFINKNLYPIATPLPDGNSPQSNWGLHFLYWPSNVHTRRFETFPLEYGVTGFERIALLENLLLHSSTLQKDESTGKRGYFVLIKNEGALVGGSVYHDHFQMLYTSQEPLSFQNDHKFLDKHGLCFSKWLVENTPKELVVQETDNWILLVPPFMKRPYDLLLVHKDPDKSFFHRLKREDLREMVFGLQNAMKLVASLFNYKNQKKAYNIVAHNNGYGALYFEFILNLQPLGGFEQAGIYLCQESPINAAETYKEMLFT